MPSIFAAGLLVLGCGHSGKEDASFQPGVSMPDAGADLACQVEYEDPGCGVQARPACAEAVRLSIGTYYCGCNGRTIMGNAVSASEPFQSQGCCPGDTGFGPLGAYSCPWDGGLPYLTPGIDGAALPPGARPSLPVDPWWYCSADPKASRVDDAGVTQWWWYFHWSAEDLAAVCTTYGAGAKMVLEVDVPNRLEAGSSELDCTTDEVVNGTTRTCTIQGAYRFEASCAAGEVLFELPSQNTFHGWYHIEGALVSETKRSLVGQGVECPRSVFVRGYVSVAPSSQDAGVSTPEAGDAAILPLDTAPMDS